jgi:hypothetical protein
MTKVFRKSKQRKIIFFEVKVFLIQCDFNYVQMKKDQIKTSRQVSGSVLYVNRK